MNVPVESIATSSAGEGLDFACSLVSQAISSKGMERPDEAPSLLNELSAYVRFRYVDELELALEALVGLGLNCNAEDFRAGLFWRQLRWVAGEMKLDGEALAKMRIPHE